MASSSFRDSRQSYWRLWPEIQRFCFSTAMPVTYCPTMSTTTSKTQTCVQNRYGTSWIMWFTKTTSMLWISWSCWKHKACKRHFLNCISFKSCKSTNARHQKTQVWSYTQPLYIIHYLPLTPLEFWHCDFYAYDSHYCNFFIFNVGFHYSNSHFLLSYS